MEKIQEILFENKETIPDGIYLELMNALKPPSDETYYEVEYRHIVPSIGWSTADHHFHIQLIEKKWEVQVSKTIIKYGNADNSIKEHIKSGVPFICSQNNVGLDYPQTVNIRHSACITQTKDSDDEDDDESFDCERLIHITDTFTFKSMIFVNKITKL